MPEILTVGHSTRTIEGFLDVLREQRIELLADVRRFPASRRYPHFTREPLAASLREVGIEYVHFPDLGGRREPRPDSRNTAWRNAAFRGYADYMETDAFRETIDRLLAAAASRRTAIMCAEAEWRNCHRSLISDYLKAAGVEVTHLIGPDQIEPHPFTSAARIVDGRLSYSEQQGSLF